MARLLRIPAQGSQRQAALQTVPRLSLPDTEERLLMQALVAEFRPDDAEAAALLHDAMAGISRWESQIAAQVGDPVRARVIRLVGDALVANAIAGTALPAADLESMLTFLVPGDQQPARNA